MSWDMRGDAEDRRFWRKHVFFGVGTLGWMLDKEAVSPEEDWIAAIDGDDPDESPSRAPSTDGIDEGLLWMWSRREAGWTWKEIAGGCGLVTAGGAWKRFHRLLAEARKNRGHSIGGR